MVRKKIYPILLFLNIILLQVSSSFASEENKKSFFGSFVKNPFKHKINSSVYGQQGEAIGKVIPIAANATPILLEDGDQSGVASYSYHIESRINLNIPEMIGGVKSVQSSAFIEVNPRLINPEEAHVFAFNQGVAFCNREIHKHARVILNEDMADFEKAIYKRSLFKSILSSITMRENDNEVQAGYQSERCQQYAKHVKEAFFGGIAVGAITASTVGIIAYFYSKKVN